MFNDAERCYQALLSRDARFDGRLFVGVTSTGVYCRPVCRVRTPRAANCRFFPSAAAAEAAGFRPCLKCRPELAPGRAAIDSGGRAARAAAAIIEEGGGERMPELAARLGVSERHLRRVFVAEFGVAPAAFARSSRLLLAKRLLAETALTVTEVAFAAGFDSLRAFNDAFRTVYRLAPGEMRRLPVTAGAGIEAGIALQLGFRPPFDWERLLRFLARRALAGVEAVDVAGGTYRRTLGIGQAGRRHLGWVEARLAPAADRIELRISPSLLPALPGVLSRLRRLLDLDCAPEEIEPVLGGLVGARSGLRLPGCVDGFEIAVRGVLGQQITVAAARTLAGRFVARFGEALETPWPELGHVFPDAARMAAVPAEEIAALGIIGRRAQSILALAQALAEGRLELSPAGDVEAQMAALQALPGIGRWTAEYLAMRALAWPDAFPGGDYGVRVALGGISEAQARRAAEVWRPWRAYAVMHLWAKLEEGS